VSDDRRWNFEIFSKRAIIPGQMGTKGILLTLAEKAIHAGGGIVGYYAIAYFPTFNPSPQSDNLACGFMAEEGRKRQHFGMTAAPPNF
jgi:hypothetical protein